MAVAGNSIEQSAPPDSSRSALLGSLALGATNFTRFALQLLVLPLMARLLGPAAFGLVALAMPFILFANMLSDAGLGSALVRVPTPSRELESTVFWLTAALGVGLAAVACLASGMVAALVRQPALASVIVALSPILVLGSSLSVANARISRERRFGVFAIGDLISLSLSSAAAIGSASAGFGAWSLVIQQLTLWGAKVAWVQSASRFRPAFVCDPTLTGDLLSFGLHKVGADIADFLGKLAPSIVIGALLGVLAVGHYSMAYQLIRIPDLIVSGPLYLATFTAVAGLSATVSEAAQLSLRNLRMIAIALTPVFVGLTLVSDLLVSVFLGYKWVGTSAILSALAPAGLLLCLYSIAGAVLMGVGRSDMQFKLALLCGLGMLAGAAVGSHWSVEFAAVGVSVGASVAAPLNALALSRQLSVPLSTIVHSLVPPLLASAVMAATVVAARSTLSGPTSVELIVCVLAGATSYSLAVAVLNGRVILADVRAFLPAKAAATLGRA